ncbi:hypothetical protein ACFQ2B_39330 [Streptomyces stramineus]|uniref:Uncharacterized protein n=1 Tax=Streptomyces stramineus TaxID=173861 RepID=A0ABN1AMU8_9ACTN
MGKRDKGDDDKDDMLPGQKCEPPKEPPTPDGASPEGDGKRRK